MIKIAAALIAALTCPLAQNSNAQEEDTSRQVRLELLVVRLPEAKALELRPLLRDPARCGAAQESILAMIGKKQAELVDWPILTTKSGQIAMTENVHELRYATQFAAPDLHVPTSEIGAVAVPEPTVPTAEEKESGKAKEPLEVRVVGGLPSAFEKRDIGVTFEVEAVVAPDGVTVEMRVVPSHVTFMGWHKVTLDHGRTERVTVKQPDFQNIKVNTNINVTSGQSVLLAFQKLLDRPNQIEVFILTTTVLNHNGVAVSKPGQTPRKQQR